MQWTNEKEKQLIESMEGVAKDIGEKHGLGLINPEYPESYYRLLCFLISYKTGTSVYDVQHKLTLFDFVAYLYIVNKFTEETNDSAPNATPESRDTSLMGMGMV
jgi:hypothetical protein